MFDVSLVSRRCLTIHVESSFQLYNDLDVLAASVHGLDVLVNLPELAQKSWKVHKQWCLFYYIPFLSKFHTSRFAKEVQQKVLQVAAVCNKVLWNVSVEIKSAFITKIVEEEHEIVQKSQTLMAQDRMVIFSTVRI